MPFLWARESNVWGFEEMRKFKPSLLSISKLKKMKEYTFDDIPEEVFVEGTRHTYELPLFYRGESKRNYLLYMYDGELYVKMFLSFQTFREAEK